ncbi:MAG: hypothetical protein VB100_03215 [Angelakisella sp.]|nr:hypothetical protein [Angelakisella sp.]
MFLECGVVLLLSLILSYLFIRSGKRATGVAVLPLVVLPVFNMFGQAFSYQLAKLGFLGALEWQVLFVFIGLLLGGTLLGLISLNIKRSKARQVYLVLCGGFTVLFAFTIIVNILPNLNFG